MKKYLSIIMCIVMAIASASIMAYAEPVSGTCGESLTWSYQDGTLTIEGTGPMDDYAQADRPWKSYSSDVTSVVLGVGVTTIGKNAFSGFSNLENLELPDKLESLGEGSLEGTALKSVTIPEGMSVGDGAVSQCNSLSEVYVYNTSIPVASLQDSGICEESSKVTVFGYIGSTAEEFADANENLIFCGAPVGSELGHDWETEWSTDVLPTCTETGTMSIHCTRCISVSEERDLMVMNHSWGLVVVTKNATCTEDGLKSYYCTRENCDAVQETVIPAYNHKYAVYTANNNATCTQNGTETAYCTACKEPNTREIAGSMLPHDYGEWKTRIAVSCTEDGLEFAICSGCKAEITRTVSSTGHIFGDWQTTKLPTGTEDGCKTRVCVNPGCSESQTEILPKTGVADNNAGADAEDDSGSDNAFLSFFQKIINWFKSLFGG